MQYFIITGHIIRATPIIGAALVISKSIQFSKSDKGVNNLSFQLLCLGGLHFPTVPSIVIPMIVNIRGRVNFKARKNPDNIQAAQNDGFILTSVSIWIVTEAVVGFLNEEASFNTHVLFGFHIDVLVPGVGSVAFLSQSKLPGQNLYVQS